jgi:hypothetical protein
VPTKVRDDLTVPVMVINTETEAFYYEAMSPQADTQMFRSWQIAGSSHAPTKQIKMIRQKTDRDGMTNSLFTYSPFCSSNVLWLPTIGAAILHVHRWINGGEVPPQHSPMEIDHKNKDVVRDQYGNGVGGIRLPEVEVPIAQYIAGAGYPLGGYTLPFTSERLKSLYPTHEEYVEKVEIAAIAARESGVILQSQVDDYIKAAQAAPIPEIPPLPSPHTIRQRS